MALAKTILGTLEIGPLEVPAIETVTLFPIKVRVGYHWAPTDAPSLRSRPMHGAVEIQVTSAMTARQIVAAARAAIRAQETDADGGGHTVTEDAST